ncbi:MAG: sensor histidine kinase [Bosea sp. (in: a-proteobacteria)]
MSGRLTRESVQIAPVAGPQARGNDEDRIGQRRMQVRNLQTVRERLTSATGLELSFENELVRQFVDKVNGPSGMIMLVMTVAVSLVTSLWISAGHGLLWSSAALLSFAGLFILARRAMEAPEDGFLANRQGLVIAIALQALVWSALVLVFLGVNDPVAKIFVVAMLMFYGTLAVMMASTVPLATYAALAPLTLALVALLVHDRQMGTMTISMVGLVGQAFLLFLGNRLYSQAVATLEFRAEKDILIAQLETATINSEDARRKAEDSNLAKSKFLATMSHELRTPLNAILGFSEVMKNEVFGPHASPSYREYASDIHSSGQHLLNLINEILDLSRIEAGRYELKEEAINLAHIADECLHMLTLRAKAKAQVIRQAVEPDLPKIWADERAMRQIILNLLSNAVKFTPQGGDIALKVGWTAAGGQYVSVTDNGPGIPENELNTVLSSFGRGSQAIKTAEEGSGLGLPIVKGLVDLHGGGFTLKSKLRVGTEVMFTIPSSRVMDTLPAIHEEPRRRTA